jgi:hypothetical protein
MITKAIYILLSTASLGLLLFEAPRGGLLTSAPERGKVERQAHSSGSGGSGSTIRSPGFVFIGGYHGGK